MPVDRTAFEIEAGHQLGRSSRDDRLLDFWPVLSFTFAKRIEPDGHTSRTSTACGRLPLDGLDVRAFKRSALHSQRATGVRYTLAGHAEGEPSEARDTAHPARPSDRLGCANRDDTEDRRNDDEHCAGAHSHRPAVLRGCTVLGLLTPAHDLQPMTPSLICTPLPTILGPPRYHVLGRRPCRPASHHTRCGPSHRLGSIEPDTQSSIVGPRWGWQRKEGCQDLGVVH